MKSVSGTEDVSTGSTLFPDQTVIGTYSVSATANNGRGTMALTSPTAANIAIWVTSATEVLGLDIDPSNPQPVILHYEQ
jgi:hypothetical protein